MSAKPTAGGQVNPNDKCARCGHERSEHCGCTEGTSCIVTWLDNPDGLGFDVVGCLCPGFREPAPAPEGGAA